jgi:hypothetical protein
MDGQAGYRKAGGASGEDLLCRPGPGTSSPSTGPEQPPGVFSPPLPHNGSGVEHGKRRPLPLPGPVHRSMADPGRFASRDRSFIERILVLNGKTSDLLTSAPLPERRRGTPLRIPDKKTDYTNSGAFAAPVRVLGECEECPIEARVSRQICPLKQIPLPRVRSINKHREVTGR